VATSLLMKNKSFCHGVEYFSKNDNSRKTVKADRVVICCGAIESPKLLLQSKSEWWPNGLGNEDGHVGKHLAVHALIQVVGERPNNPLDIQQPVDFPTLCSREFDDEMHQPDGKFFFVSDGRKRAIVLEDEVHKGNSLHQVRAQIRSGVPLELRGFVEMFSDPSCYISTSDETSSIGIRKTVVSYSTPLVTQKAIGRAEGIMELILRQAGCKSIRSITRQEVRADHATSTCRMSTAPEQGVVDQNLRIHGVDNVFVCSNAVIPNGSAVNPTLTLVLNQAFADSIFGLISGRSIGARASVLARP